MRFCLVVHNTSKLQTEGTTVDRINKQSKSKIVLPLPWPWWSEYAGLGLQTRTSKPHGDVTPGRTKK